MIEKKFDDKGFYLFIKSNPIVTLENMLNGLEYLQKDTTLPRDLRIFEDATNVEVTFDISVVDLLQEKSMYGKKYMGVLRTTFVFDENGIITEVFEKVDTKEQTNQIMDAIN